MAKPISLVEMERQLKGAFKDYDSGGLKSKYGGLGQNRQHGSQLAYNAGPIDDVYLPVNVLAQMITSWVDGDKKWVCAPRALERDFGQPSMNFQARTRKDLFNFHVPLGSTGKTFDQVLDAAQVAYEAT